MTKFILKRNSTDHSMFEMWSEDERHFFAIIHEDALGRMGNYGAGSYAELFLVEEDSEDE